MSQAPELLRSKWPIAVCVLLSFAVGYGVSFVSRNSPALAEARIQIADFRIAIPEGETTVTITSRDAEATALAQLQYRLGMPGLSTRNPREAYEQMKLGQPVLCGNLAEIYVAVCEAMGLTARVVGLSVAIQNGLFGVDLFSGTHGLSPRMTRIGAGFSKSVKIRVYPWPTLPSRLLCSCFLPRC